MHSTELPNRLSQIRTPWSLVFAAHRDEVDQARRAQQQLIHRYSGAIYRYILGAVRNPDVALDLAQDFALRLIEGDFQRADPGKGRFRDFLKTSLYHMVVDYQRRKKPVGLADDMPEPAAPAEPLAPDFESSWRQELLDQAWAALREEEQDTEQPYYTVLRYKADHPEARAAQMAERLEGALGKRLSEAAMRKTVQRARERFAALLLDEVARQRQTDDPEVIAEELADLDLLAYCQPAVERLARR